MSLESDLYSKITGDSGVSALIGTRFYPAGDVPEKPTIPCATYSVIGENNFPAMGANTQTTEKLVQVSCFAELAKTNGAKIGARSIAEAIKNAINRQTGSWGTQTIAHCMMLDSSDDYDSEMQLNITAQRYRILYR